MRQNYCPKLRPEPIDIYINSNAYRIPREHLLAAYAGNTAVLKYVYYSSFKVKSVQGESFFKDTFKEEYHKAIPECTEAANKYLSATWEMLSDNNPVNYMRVSKFEN